MGTREKRAVKKKFDKAKAIEELSRLGYTVAKQEVMTDRAVALDIGTDGASFKIGLVSDTHFGSRYQQPTHLWSFYQRCAREGVEIVLHAGDLTDGGSLYRGQEFELFCHGADAQADYVVRSYPNIAGITTYVIAGNHDENHWKVAGVDVCRRVSEERDDIKHLGFYGAYVYVGGINIYLHHGTGGGAYARSYKLQKFIEQIAPEQKPQILVMGHYHSSVLLPMYRNVAAIQMPCFQAQSPYLKAKGLYPEIAGVILEFAENKENPGLVWIKPEWVFYFVPKKNDF